MQLQFSTLPGLLAVFVAFPLTSTFANPVEINSSPIPSAFPQSPSAGASASVNAGANANGPSIQEPERPIPSLKPEQATASQSLVHSIATLIASSAASSLDPTTCPPTHNSRQCCTSVDSLADDVVGEDAIGGLIPWFQGVKISSIVGFQYGTKANVDSGNRGDRTNLNGQPGTQSLFKSGCIPYDKAIQDKKEAIEKSKAEASYLAAQSSSVPTPTPSK
ncbi:predicted protein [Aspergillus nidulans FGSC A4]|uniref:Hydrophobin n=1 Tax=Emericella nidulans (strain FGSC A4 / ATCC 38163 / CBS 112.46 / NRRL 194 / M139) TaxID=227321 RepID=Q5AU34_EMENI|nr:hypothetical protein [Aspergillus nidulans FGSC A4]EAA58840.1 predicted protein [Aspergillus nidulans FGSC A4]CBF74087.1 TPA: hypothetical protein ANIA_08196 [Aspergillus nidulans FGSC A4]|eukprot:XP_681465.1 predicted protein [Aspergillus nidulans FGSC A4]